MAHARFFLLVLADRPHGSLRVTLCADVRRWRWRQRVAAGAQHAPPWTIVGLESFRTMAEAARRAKAMRFWPRERRLAWVQERNPRWIELTG